MTEIPEHLLKRSRDRRAGGASSEASSAPVPATTESASPAPKAAAETPAQKPISKPDSPDVAAAKARGRIPYWAMGTLALMPIFLFMYVRGLQPQKAEANSLIVDDDDLSWRDVADILCADQVEGTGLGGKDRCAVQSTHAERAKSSRIPNRNKPVRSRKEHRECPLISNQRLGDGRDDIP